MVTIAIGQYIQAQGTLVRLVGNIAYINDGGRLLVGKLVTPIEKIVTSRASA